MTVAEVSCFSALRCGNGEKISPYWFASLSRSSQGECKNTSKRFPGRRDENLDELGVARKHSESISTTTITDLGQTTPLGKGHRRGFSGPNC